MSEAVPQGELARAAERLRQFIAGETLDPQAEKDLQTLAIGAGVMGPEAKEQQEASTPEPERPEALTLGEGQFWGVFDEADLIASQIVLPVVGMDGPVPIALFESKEEAEGYVKLVGLSDATPAIRPCTVRGTVTLTLADVKGSEQ